MVVVMAMAVQITLLPTQAVLAVGLVDTTLVMVVRVRAFLDKVTLVLLAVLKVGVEMAVAAQALLA
jgi:hypothetical protein